MKKSITVILKANNLKEDPRKRIKKVARGYAFNYLIPNKMAEIATEGKIKNLNIIYKTMSKKVNKIHNTNIRIKQIIEKINILHIRKKCSQNKLIFGSISEQEIIEKILKLTGETIEKKQILLETIKEIGKHKIKIHFEENLYTLIEIKILPKTL